MLQLLTERQFVRPHSAVGDVLDDVGQLARVCPDVADRAVRWLSLDTTQPIGRLRRTQLTQLAQCISRFERALHVAPAQKV
ncbi:MAG TPA: hypothetical protein VK324_07655 [Tepidisphaeraceae bacterium]|nr:hypothetical protein [Tepidisphaeraceae bacterium]